jgi:hypothetical protein
LATSLVIISVLVMAFSQDKKPMPPPPPQAMEQSTPSLPSPAKLLPPMIDETMKRKMSAEKSDTIPGNEYSVIYSDYDKPAGRETIEFKKDKIEY